MARILPVFQGDRFGDWGECAWSQCVELFELDEFCRTEERPRFIAQADDPLVPGTVVIYLGPAEARRHGVRPGYFFSPLDGMAAMGRLHGVGAEANLALAQPGESRSAEVESVSRPRQIDVAQPTTSASVSRHEWLAIRLRASLARSRALCSQSRCLNAKATDLLQRRTELSQRMLRAMVVRSEAE